jgi:hypothetical protein
LISFIVRQAHHKRNQKFTVSPELVEGLNKNFVDYIAILALTSAKDGLSGEQVGGACAACRNPGHGDGNKSVRPEFIEGQTHKCSWFDKLTTNGVVITLEPEFRDAK